MNDYKKGTIDIIKELNKFVIENNIKVTYNLGNINEIINQLHTIGYYSNLTIVDVSKGEIVLCIYYNEFTQTNVYIGHCLFNVRVGNNNIKTITIKEFTGNDNILEHFKALMFSFN